jgi:hypothetical protein
MRFLMFSVAVLVVAACERGATHLVVPESPKPNEGMAQTFKACTWGEVKGEGVSVWSYACGAGTGDLRLQWNADANGFDIVGAGAAAPAIRILPRAADAPLDSVLDAVRALSPGPASATCVFQAAAGVDHDGKNRFVFAPTGEAKAAYEAAISGPDVPPEPCGALGVGPTGQVTFELVGHDKVVMINHGSEIQIFDAGTLQFAGSAPGGAHSETKGGH